MGYILLFALLYVTKDNQKIRLIIEILLVVFFYNKNVYLGEILIGAFGGDCYEYIVANKKISGESIFLRSVAIICIILIPLMYNEHNITNARSYIVSFLLVMIIVIVIIVSNDVNRRSLLNNKILFKLEQMIFSFYLVHAMVLDFCGKAYRYLINLKYFNDTSIALAIVYPISVILTIMLAFFFHEVFMPFVNFGFEKTWFMR